MDQNEILSSFGDDYKVPFTSSSNDDNDWSEWAQTVEIRLSRQGRIMLGIGAGLGVTLLLTVMQGKVVVNLVKGHKMLIEAINTMVEGVQPTKTDYTQPTGYVDVSKAEPVDEVEAQELKDRLAGYDDEPKFGEL